MIAEQRCQIREVADPDTDSDLVQHVATDDGRPACGQPVLPWHDRAMRAVLTGRGEVTCGSGRVRRLMGICAQYLTLLLVADDGCACSYCARIRHAMRRMRAAAP